MSKPRQFRKTVRISLMELLKTSPLDSITIAKLKEYTGLSKQSFYYHASNLPKYLQKRIFELTEEYAYECGENANLIPLAMEQGMKYALEIKPIILGMVSSKRSSEYMNTFRAAIYQETSNIIHRHMHRFQSETDENKLRFVSDCFAGSISSILISYFMDGMEKDPVELCKDYQALIGKPISILIEDFLL